MSLPAIMLSGRSPCFSAMPPHATMGQAITAMHQTQRSAVTVMDGGRLQGIVTRTDMLKSLDLAGNKDQYQRPLSSIMTSKLVVTGPQKTMQHALERMARSNIEHLPVMEDGRLLTVVHESDLLRQQLTALNDDINYLPEYIDGLHHAGQD